MKIIITSFLTSFIIGFNFAQSVEFDHSGFNKLLSENVDENGMVNYEGFNNNTQFEEYLNRLETADVNNFSKEEQLAFYINAYNATVINNVINYLPINSPMDVDGFFNKVKHNVAGNMLTLDELEHKFILKIEPVLVHFGLVCAANSCPKLINKAYNGEMVFNQLVENAKVFLNDDQKNRIDKENKILYLSEIFKWFNNNFVEKYGSLKKTAIEFMYENDAKYLRENDVQIKYLKYNWKLNSQ